VYSRLLSLLLIHPHVAFEFRVLQADEGAERTILHSPAVRARRPGGVRSCSSHPRTQSCVVTRWRLGSHDPWQHRHRVWRPCPRGALAGVRACCPPELDADGLRWHAGFWHPHNGATVFVYQSTTGALIPPRSSHRPTSSLSPVHVTWQVTGGGTLHRLISREFAARQPPNRGTRCPRNLFPPFFLNLDLPTAHFQITTEVWGHPTHLHEIQPRPTMH
jgi:hypothetical protein